MHVDRRLDGTRIDFEFLRSSRASKSPIDRSNNVDGVVRNRIRIIRVKVNQHGRESNHRIWWEKTKR